MAEAVAQLRKGLALLALIPDGSRRQQQELNLHIALLPALTATKGYSAPDVGETIARARTLSEQLDGSAYLVPLLITQWVFHLVRGEHRLSLPCAEQVEQLGETSNDVAVLLLGRAFHGMTRLFLGEFVTARALLEQCHGLSDPEHRAVYAALKAEDPYATALAHFAPTLTCLGYIDQGRVQMKVALSAARGLEHAHTLALVLYFAGLADWIAKLPNEARHHAEEAVALSNEHGFPVWLGLGTFNLGWALAALGRAQEGLALLTKALPGYRATGSVSGTPIALVMLAEVYAQAGRPVEGLNCLTEAAQIIETTDERFPEAEMHRLRGDLLIATGDRAAAEQSYQAARALAIRQSAKAFELRAATSLARLWRDHGRRDEARGLLAAIYGWFTEGLETPVLRDAKALFDELTDGPSLLSAPPA